MDPTRQLAGDARLQERVMPLFSARDMDAGEFYFRTGRVAVRDRQGGVLRGTVRAERDLDVVIEPGDGGAAIGLACACQTPGAGTPCAHLWALILAADEALLARPRAAAVEPAVDRLVPWRERMQRLRSALDEDGETVWDAARGASRQLLYRLAPAPDDAAALDLDILQREVGPAGAGAPRPFRPPRGGRVRSADPLDQRLISLLLGGDRDRTAAGASRIDATDGRAGRASRPRHLRLDARLAAVLIPELCASGRCFTAHAGDVDFTRPVVWDGDRPWELEVRLEEDADVVFARPMLRRGEERLAPDEGPVAVLESGFVFYGRHVAPFVPPAAARLLGVLVGAGAMPVLPRRDAPDLVAELLELPVSVPLVLPPPWREGGALAPKARLHVVSPAGPATADSRLDGEVSFDYGGVVVGVDDPRRYVVNEVLSVWRRRDEAFERIAIERLLAVGVERASRGRVRVPAPRLETVVVALVDAGWRVEADGGLFRACTATRAAITSGVDWFELRGGLEFQDEHAAWPSILDAIRRRRKSVRLGDGTFGVLPTEWLGRHGLLLETGEPLADGLRFDRSRASGLDDLVADTDQGEVDARFRELRHAIAGFRAIDPRSEPESFLGRLRPYQREALGWFAFLRETGFGGCLADDMGLGKTVQVLALLEERRVATGGRSTSLVVAPSSVVPNWIDEARRFAPGLVALDLTGEGRTRDAAALASAHLIVTSYGILRREADLLAALDLDYAVLDEAQNIKNGRSFTTEAARRLHASHRLALSGTPIENALSELGSLFEFLNPGLLRGDPRLTGVLDARAPDEAGLRRLAAVVRPFILRRTKRAVATDLPPKTEQLLRCDLAGEDADCYEELRLRFRQDVLGRIVEGDEERHRVQVLEALLRLRQAACHPGLIDRRRRGEPSAKVDLLLGHLERIHRCGEKALVFSQFTGLLDIVGDALERRGIDRVRLDGATADRRAPVRRFQGEAALPVFLISLKAGGVGLNLTAADYVFLLDPWWNPAAEAQAIDRAHRIGREAPVFVYRLIARGTVEEKVLELQERKRALADSIIVSRSPGVRGLLREDLELLFG